MSDIQACEWPKQRNVSGDSGAEQDRPTMGCQHIIMYVAVALAACIEEEDTIVYDGLQQWYCVQSTTTVQMPLYLWMLFG